MRDDFSLTLLYLFIIAFALGRWWSGQSLKQARLARKVNLHAFLSETIHVKIEIENQGWLPLLWLRAQEALPVALSSVPSFGQVASLGPKGRFEMEYSLEARKRGYYQLGPTFVSTGDILGLTAPDRREAPGQFITVYPKIIPLTHIGIPSRSPQGTLRHHQPIFEDPTRVLSKRDYIPGDSMRRVDWKSSAVTGKLQVKVFEPSISLETLVFLDLSHDGYHYRHRIDSTELAIVIAASMLTWVIGKGQTAGLKVNGRDPLLPKGLPQYSPPRKGQGHLVRMLESLARVESCEAQPIAEIIQQQRFLLPWGTSLIVITGAADDNLLGELHQARRAGQNTLLVLAGPVAYSQDITHRAARFGIPVVSIASEQEMDIWRR